MGNIVMVIIMLFICKFLIIILILILFVAEYNREMRLSRFSSQISKCFVKRMSKYMK